MVHQRRRRKNKSRGRRRNRNNHHTGEPDGLQPNDDLGNRKKAADTRVPPDDIGNRKPPETEEASIADGHGNRIEASPTHNLSGVLADIDGKRKKRRRMGPPLERMGRYYMGGVNPLVSGNPFYVQQAAEAERKERETVQEAMAEQMAAEELKRRTQLWEKKAKRLFDFDGEGRFEYKLKTSPEEKCEMAQDAMSQIMKLGGLETQIVTRLVGNEQFPHVVIKIIEAEGESLFHKGSGALLSLNFLINKMVNRYPDDRIRLAVMPADEEEMFIQLLDDALAAYEEVQKERAAAAASKEASKAPEGLKTQAEPVAEPAAESGAEPAAESVADPAVELAAEPAVELAAEPAAESAAEPETALKAKSKVKAKKSTTKKKTTKKATASSAKVKAKKVTKKKATTKKKVTKKVTKKATTKKKVSKKA